MKKFLQVVYFVFLIVSLGAILIGCSPAVPNVEDVEVHFRNNYEDVQIVVDFMKNTEYCSVYINSADGKMQADLEIVSIEDENVRNALERLLKTPLVGGKQYYSVSKSGNTINFFQWKGAQDIGCGVAYSIDGTALPDIEYCTELVPLSETGWYYYVDDYNAWRVGERPQTGGQGDGSVVP